MKTNDDIAIVSDAAMHLSDGTVCRIGSDFFYQWLNNNSSFRVERGEDSYRARKELLRGQSYWYAIKKVGGLHHKKYIGTTQEVSLERLSAIADIIRVPPKSRVKTLDDRIQNIEEQIEKLRDELENIKSSR